VNGSAVDAVYVEDRLAIYDLFVRYADALDYRRWELLDDVFTEDVVSVWPTGSRLAGRQALIELIQRHFAGIGATHHLMGNFSLALENGLATASVRMRAYHAGAGERAELFEESLGTFDGRARRTPDGWRFEHFSEAIFVVLGSYEVFGLPGGLTTNDPVGT
jgi:SnoaL-like domain